MTQRTPEEAQAAIEAARRQVEKQGGTIHEDAGWDVAEMALDGQSQQSMVQRLQQQRAEEYRPEGTWRVR
jgi:hypothetical protein